MMQSDLDILAIVGSTRFAYRGGLDIARRLIRELLDTTEPDIVCSGGAPGVDTIAEEEAERRGILFDPFLPKVFAWTHPDGGFKERNEQIAAHCTRLFRIACAASGTYGSGWTADLAEDMGKPVTRRWIDVNGVVHDTAPATPAEAMKRGEWRRDVLF